MGKMRMAMTGHARKLLLFDLDGTLLLTGGAGTRSFEGSFVRHFRVKARTEGVRMDGMTDPAIARHILKSHGLPHDDEAVARVLEGYLAYLESAVAASRGYQVLPDVIDALEDLSRRADVVLGLATGNIERGARIKLERAGLNRFFPFGGFGSDSEDRAKIVRTAIARGSGFAGEEFGKGMIVVIGDTPKDVAAGKAAGVKTVAVATGSYDLDALRACSPDAAIPTLANPSGWLSSLI